MKFSRPSRIIAALIALCCMLFAQLALASYVCPGMQPENGNAVAMAGMPGCAGMDSVQSSLCHAHAHDQASKQSSDMPELPVVQPFVPATLMLALSVIDISVPPSAHASRAAPLTRTTAPPIAIRHCCFRI